MGNYYGRQTTAKTPHALISIGTVDEPIDLADGSFESEIQESPGADVIDGDLVSDQDESFDVFIDWYNASGAKTGEHNPTALQDARNVGFTLKVKSARFAVRIEDTSGNDPNEVHGNIDAH